MEQGSKYNGQIRIGDPRPIKSEHPWTIGSGGIAVAVVVGLFAFSLAFVPGRIMDRCVYWVVVSLPVRWRRLKRLMGIRR